MHVAETVSASNDIAHH